VINYSATETFMCQLSVFDLCRPSI